MENYKTYLKTEIGVLEIVGNENRLLEINFLDSQPVADSTVPPALEPTVNQLKEYFTGKRKEFNLKIQMQGTEFQKAVWQELIRIPFGVTASYQEIARRVGNEKAVRAVGSANSLNKIAIVIPCHRVIGSNQKLTGYAGGLWRKSWLLEHERNISSR